MLLVLLLLPKILTEYLDSPPTSTPFPVSFQCWWQAGSLLSLTGPLSFSPGIPTFIKPKSFRFSKSFIIYHSYYWPCLLLKSPSVSKMLESWGLFYSLLPFTLKFPSLIFFYYWLFVFHLWMLYLDYLEYGCYLIKFQIIEDLYKLIPNGLF